MSDDFVRDLELELTAAARRRAARRRPALRPPRPAPLLAVCVLALAIVGAVALIARTGGGDRAGDERPVPPPGGTTVPLLASLPPARCRDLPVANARSGVTDLGLLRRPQHEPDAIPPPQGNAITWLPVRSFDPRESRLAGRERLDPPVHVVPSRGVPEEGRCATDEGPGLCLVEADLWFRCFPQAELARGGVVMRLRSGAIAGLAPDGVTRVTVDGVAAEVVENAYVIEVPAAGPSVRVALHGETCSRGIVDAVLDRVPILSRESQGPLPAAAATAVREWGWRFDAIVEDGARPWGGGDGVRFWVVPAVSRGSGPCAPADGACVVAVPDAAEANAHCEVPLRAGYRVTPLLEENAVVYGFVDRDVGGVRLRRGEQTATVPAAEGVVGGAAPFAYAEGMDFTTVPAERKPRVAVVDATFATGDARRVLRLLQRWQYDTVDEPAPGVTPQEPTCVYWRRDSTTMMEATEVAELVGADDVIVLDGTASRPVAAAAADVVVQVGSPAPPDVPEGQRRPSC